MLERVRRLVKRKGALAEKSKLLEIRKTLEKVTAEDPTLRKKVELFIETLSKWDDPLVQQNDAIELLNRHVEKGGDTEALRTALKHASIFPDDPKATLGKFLLFFAVKHEENAGGLRKLLDATDERFRKYLGRKMFQHQYVNKVPGAGLIPVLEAIARRYNYNKTVMDRIQRIKNSSSWNEEAESIWRKIGIKYSVGRELAEKGANQEQIKKIQEFIRMQEEEQGKGPLGKRSLIWKRKKSRE